MKDIRCVYDEINNCSNKFGEFHKACFHLHTPESYDYKMFKDWNEQKYKELSEQELFKICVDNKVIHNQLSLDDVKIEGDYKIYKSKKELLAFYLLADGLAKSEIEIVLVTDHNTIDGVDKLKFAIKDLYKIKKYKVFTQVFLGIEISCADKNHVIGLFDNTSEIKQQIQNWLNENLLAIKEGSFETSIDVLKFIKEINGFGYIAHIDTSDTFKESFLSCAYKRKLFTDEICFVGLSDFSRKNDIEMRIKQISNQKKQIKFLLDNDAHDIETISEKIFWIKSSKCNYSAIIEALNDYEISVSFTIEKSADQYIKGIYIENNNKGFLSGKNSESFCMNFSNALNCIIGGRGTGKSSILKMLEFVLSQSCENNKDLEFLCNHGDVYLLYEYYGKEYIIRMVMPVKEYPDDNILQRFGMNPNNYFHYKYFFNKSDVQQFALHHYLNIYSVSKENNDLIIKDVYQKKEILQKFFDTRYSVNDLVNTASGEQINKFIYDTLFKNKKLSKPQEVICIKNKKNLSKVISDVEKLLLKRKDEVESTIIPFNKEQEKVLKICYLQNGKYEEPKFGKLLFEEKYHPDHFYEKYNIKQESIVYYFQNLFEKLEPLNFLKLMLNADGNDLQHHLGLYQFCEQLTSELVNKGIMSLNKEIETKLLDEFISKIISDNKIGFWNEYLKKYVSNIEVFTLEFNINNKETNEQKVIFRDVLELSLGQKVVAMLNFVLGYSEYSKDYRPLIIDQPEDNLDSQYIYKNLVYQLRKIKEKRQVIIATHNATIVTNAKADQVCVMESDNEHGWINVTGYPSEKRIKKQILNYLEGGKESFLHKEMIYKDALI